MYLNENIKIIYEELKNYTNEKFENTNEMIEFIYKLDDSNRIELIEKINEKLGKNISLDIYNINAARIMSSKSKNCRLIAAGMDYVSLKSKLINKYSLDENDIYVSLKQISKMTLNERLDKKTEIDRLNTQNNIYEDIGNFLMNTKSKSSNKNIQNNIEKIYNDYVINDVNESIINNIMNNKEIYSALVIVSKDRLNNLHDKLIDQLKF
jgi:chaperonin cofactor prefoldin